MIEILLATNNPKKLAEFREILRDLPICLILPETLEEPVEVVEDGDTFEANARKKAGEFVKASGKWALADDSGLEVDHLDGRPGVRSSRFAGPDATDRDNNQKLLELMKGVPASMRGGRFRCVLCLRSPGGEEILTHGAIEGMILDEERGQAGFGYDPVFLVPSEGKSLAELGTGYKNLHSHRARAAAVLRQRIEERFARERQP